MSVMRVRESPFLLRNLDHLRALIDKHQTAHFPQIIIRAIPARSTANFQYIAARLSDNLLAQSVDSCGGFEERDTLIEGGGGLVVAG